MSPCKDCPDRHIGCHGQCAAYVKYRTDCEQIRITRSIERAVDGYFAAVQHERKRRYLEHHRKLKSGRGVYTSETAANQVH